MKTAFNYSRSIINFSASENWENLSMGKMYKNGQHTTIAEINNQDETLQRIRAKVYSEEESFNQCSDRNIFSENLDSISIS